MTGVKSRLRSFFRRKRIEDELEQELHFHNEEAITARMAAGITREEAQRQIAIELGGSDLIREECRDVHRVAYIENLLLDVRYSLRSLNKTPSFTILAVLILALGIGANTAMFTVVDAILLRPLPYPEPGHLVAISKQEIGVPATLVALRQQSKLAEYAGYTQNSEVNLTGQGDPARLVASEVSANFFHVLGVRPLIGRDFRDGEDEIGHGQAVLISYQFWKSRFNGDPEAVGRSLLIDDRMREIVGVMPADFTFPNATTQLWMPIQIDRSNVSAYWYESNLPLIGRLKEGASLADARAEFGVVLGRLLTQYKSILPWWGSGATLEYLDDVMVKGIRGYLLLLFGAVGLVLLIACANFANLLVVRNTIRRKELSVRAALGASRARISQQVTTESLIVALAGGALGFGLAWAGTGLLTSFLPADTPRLSGITIDFRVLGFTAAVSILTGIAFGLIPAFAASRIGRSHSLRLSERGPAGGSKVLLAAFVVFEIAVSVVVLVAAGLLAKSVSRLSGQSPGFDSGHVLALQVSPPDSLCKEAGHCLQFYDELLDKIRALPGVTNVSATSSLPIAGGPSRFAAELEGHPWTQGTPVNLVWDWTVTTDYLKTMGIPLLSGRDFSSADAESAEPVALVSAATAEQYWPRENPIGKHIRGIWQKNWHRVIGVVGDVHTAALGVDPSVEQAQAYFPFANAVRFTTMMTLVIRTAGDPLELVHPVREAVGGLSKDVPVSHIQTMQEALRNSISEPRSMMYLLAAFAALALLLGAAGIYGVISYSVTERWREIGIRMALGAVPSSVARLILSQGLRYAVIGLVIGVPAALAAARVLHSQLFEVSAADPLTYALGACVIAGMALFAAWVPAYRAVRLDPAVAIRDE